MNVLSSNLYKLASVSFFGGTLKERFHTGIYLLAQTVLAETQMSIYHTEYLLFLMEQEKSNFFQILTWSNLKERY